ncbi:hypothetical protein OBBRIDRAFT_829600 [Obba rivulosa]|uniref:Uncharacterized protein n=1 Tax=Obba rivulosa TaxID=1052685 RepID=A0A8E2DIX8_9APHY|nr:hypothetical protein OBBRIDRAFT_829600 [Obba rivulosa]
MTSRSYRFRPTLRDHMLDQLEADCHDAMEDAIALWGAGDGHEFDDTYSSDEYDDARTGNDAPADDESARGSSDLAPSSPGNSIDVSTPSTPLSLMSTPASITESEDQDEDELMSTSTSSSMIILAALEKIAALFAAEHDRVCTTQTLFRNPSAL